MKSSVAAPASSIVIVEARIAVEQPGLRVHLDDDRIHRREHLVVGVDDEVGALGDDPQLVVGDDRGDLDDAVAGVVEPGHLEIHPHEHARGT